MLPHIDIDDLRHLEPKEIGKLDACLERYLRNQTSSSIATMHNSTVLSSEGALVLIGESGRGKTTLGLTCAIAGMPHVGDEFGFIDLAEGTCWQSEYPLCLKQGSPFFQIALQYGVSAISPIDIPYVFVDRATLLRSIGATISESCGPFPIKAFIFLERTEIDGPVLENQPLIKWSQDLLISVEARLSRNELFASLLNMISQNGIDMLKLRYKEADGAASLISSRFGVPR